MTGKKAKKIDFEASIQELETVVENLEKGEQTLEQALQSYERGVELTRLCQETLQQAEQRVRMLSGQDEVEFSNDA